MVYVILLSPKIRLWEDALSMRELRVEPCVSLRSHLLIVVVSESSGFARVILSLILLV